MVGIERLNEEAFFQWQVNKVTTHLQKQCSDFQTIQKSEDAIQAPSRPYKCFQFSEVF